MIFQLIGGWLGGVFTFTPGTDPEPEPTAVLRGDMVRTGGAALVGGLLRSATSTVRGDMVR